MPPWPLTLAQQLARQPAQPLMTSRESANVSISYFEVCTDD